MLVNSLLRLPVHLGPIYRRPVHVILLPEQVSHGTVYVVVPVGPRLSRGLGRQERRNKGCVMSRLEEPFVRSQARRRRADGVEPDENRILVTFGLTLTLSGVSEPK